MRAGRRGARMRAGAGGPGSGAERWGPGRGTEGWGTAAGEEGWGLGRGPGRPGPGQEAPQAAEGPWAGPAALSSFPRGLGSSVRAAARRSLWARSLLSVSRRYRIVVITSGSRHCEATDP